LGLGGARSRRSQAMDFQASRAMLGVRRALSCTFQRMLRSPRRLAVFVIFLEEQVSAAETE
jgi:hypothetical protein